MMLIGSNTVVAQKHDHSSLHVMAAVLCAAFDRAKPISDDGSVHSEYRAADRLTMAEAIGLVQDGILRAHLTVLFLKGRQVMLHIRPGHMAHSIQVCNEIVDEPWPIALFEDAQRILNRTEHCPVTMN